MQILCVVSQKSFSFWGTLSPRPPTGASPLDPTGGLLSPRTPVFFYIPPIILWDQRPCVAITVIQVSFICSNSRSGCVLSIAWLSARVFCVTGILIRYSWHLLVLTSVSYFAGSHSVIQAYSHSSPSILEAYLRQMSLCKITNNREENGIE